MTPKKETFRTRLYSFKLQVHESNSLKHLIHLSVTRNEVTFILEEFNDWWLTKMHFLSSDLLQLFQQCWQCCVYTASSAPDTRQEAVPSHSHHGLSYLDSSAGSSGFNTFWDCIKYTLLKWSCHCAVLSWSCPDSAWIWHNSSLKDVCRVCSLLHISSISEMSRVLQKSTVETRSGGQLSPGCCSEMNCKKLLLCVRAGKKDIITVMLNTR